MTDLQQAVFLSYASEDRAAARRIGDALAAVGIEVWLDQSELRGGDAWDAAIRQQIRSCALFVPIISANSRARIEGYFRLEWKLAVDRSHLMAAERTFIVPVVIDDTREDDARVPDRFREVQWTTLPGGDTTAAFVTRIAKLLSSGSALASPSTSATVATATRAPGDGAATTTPAPARSRRKTIPVLATALVVVVAAAFIAKHFFAARPESGTAESPAVAPSIAVLPFVDMSEKKDQEYFSDGLSEELIDLLVKGTEMRVPARTSSFSFKGTSATIPQIAAKLGVTHVLEGSVRKSGQTLRVTAQLIRASDGIHLWSETYDRDIRDVFKVQDEIAGAVVTALKTKLTSVQASVSAHRTSNPEAYAQYLLGKEFFRQENQDGYVAAAAAFRRTVALDPGFAPAWADLAVVEATADLVHNQQQALADAERAITLSPVLSDGYSARGMVATMHGDWERAAADARKAVELDPRSSVTQRRYGRLMADTGQLAQAIAAERHATELDPLDFRAWHYLGLYLAANGQLEEARAAYHKSLENHAGWVNPQLGLLALDLLEGRTESSFAFLREPLRPDEGDTPDVRLALQIYAANTAGHKADAQRSLDELILRVGKTQPSGIAQAYAWLGERDHAFVWLDRAVAEHDPGIESIKYDFEFVKLRDDPRFRAVLQKLKLPVG